MSAKTKFSTEERMGVSNVVNSADYSITHKISPFSDYQVSHKSNGQCALEGNFKIHDQPNWLIVLHTNQTLNQSQTKRELPSKFLIRVHHVDNKIFSVGFEDWDMLSGRNPDILSVSGVFGQPINNDYRGVFGIYTGFKLSSQNILFHKYLLGIKHKNFSAYIEAGMTTVQEKSVHSESKLTTIEEKTRKHVNLLVDGRLNDNLKLSSDLKVAIDSGIVDSRLAGEYRIDNETVFKMKLQNDNSIGASITHNFRKLITLGFAARVNYYLFILVAITYS